jgi:hypothetical protein
MARAARSPRREPRAATVAPATSSSCASVVRGVRELAEVAGAVPDGVDCHVGHSEKVPRPEIREAKALAHGREGLARRSCEQAERAASAFDRLPGGSLGLLGQRARVPTQAADFCSATNRDEPRTPKYISFRRL